MKSEEFYKDKTNQYYIRMMEIIDYRRKNVLVYINSVKDRPKDYIKCQRHHIIPRAWYRHHGYEIDNSKDNIVYLTPSEHLEVHVMLREYFKCVNDLDMHYAMALAVDRMSNGNPEWIDKVVNDDNEKQFFLKTYEDNINKAAEATAYRYRQMSPEERAELAQKISDGWKNMDKDRYDKLCDKRIENGKMFWTDPSYKTGSEEWKQHQSESQKRARANKSDAQKEAERQRQIDFWKNMPEERKQQLRDEQVRIQTERWNNKSEEEKRKHAEKISQAYQNKSEEKKRLHQERRSESMKRYFQNMTPEQKKALSQQRSTISKGKKFMSNDKLMKVIQVRPEQIPELLEQGWIVGNRSKHYKKLKQQAQSDT